MRYVLAVALAASIASPGEAAKAQAPSEARVNCAVGGTRFETTRAHCNRLVRDAIARSNRANAPCATGRTRDGDIGECVAPIRTVIDRKIQQECGPRTISRCWDLTAHLYAVAAECENYRANARSAIVAKRAGQSRTTVRGGLHAGQLPASPFSGKPPGQISTRGLDYLVDQAFSAPPNEYVGQFAWRIYSACLRDAEVDPGF